MAFKNFVADRVERVLEYLKQNPLVIYVRRSVDAYMAAYALTVVFGETTHVSLVDWPPASGVCVGFKCDGFYLTESEVGIDGERYNVSYASLSHLAAVIIKTLSSLEDVRNALYVGHHSWSVDYCEYKCPLPEELSTGDEKLAVVLPNIDKSIKKALASSTLPIIPGVTGRQHEVELDNPITWLDWALGVTAVEGFHTSILDKAIRPHPQGFNPADYAQRIEADLAGFTNVEDYVSNISEVFYTVLKVGDTQVYNSFYVYKLPPYLSYAKTNKWITLRYEAGRGYVVAVVPPLSRRSGLKAAAGVFQDVGHVLTFSTNLVVFVESGRYIDFLKTYEKVKS